MSDEWVVGFFFLSLFRLNFFIECNQNIHYLQFFCICNCQIILDNWNIFHDLYFMQFLLIEFDFKTLQFVLVATTFFIFRLRGLGPLNLRHALHLPSTSTLCSSFFFPLAFLFKFYYSPAQFLKYWCLFLEQVSWLSFKSPWRQTATTLDTCPVEFI